LVWGFEAVELVEEFAFFDLVEGLVVGVGGGVLVAFLAEGLEVAFDFLDLVAELKGGGGGEAGLGGETLAEVGVAEEVEALFHFVGGEGGAGGGAEFLDGLAGAEGELEVGLEAEGFAKGVEGGLEGGLAEPAAQDGDGGPVLRGWAGGGFAEGSEKKSLGAGGSLDVWHNFLLWNELWIFRRCGGLEKAPPLRRLFHPRFTPL